MSVIMAGIEYEDVEWVEAFCHRMAWPQQSTYGRTAEPIEVVSYDPTQVHWRYHGSSEVRRTPMGTFTGQVRLTPVDNG